MDVSCILEGIIAHFSAPNLDPSGPFQMLISQTSSNQYFGKLAIGRIQSGTLYKNDKLSSVDRHGSLQESSKVMKILK